MTEETAEASTSQATVVQQGPRTRRQKRLAEEGADCLAVTSKKVRNSPTSRLVVSTQTQQLIVCSASNELTDLASCAEEL